MTKLLIVYGTTEGQTRKIAEWVGARTQEIGHSATVHDSASAPAELDVSAYDAVFVAASVHQGRYQASLVHFVKDNLGSLQDRPTTFLSVSLSSVLDEGKDEAQEYIDSFLAETGWRPTRSEPVAGAQSRSRKFEQCAKWIFCLTAGTVLPANQELR